MMILRFLMCFLTIAKAASDRGTIIGLWGEGNGAPVGPEKNRSDSDSDSRPKDETPKQVIPVTCYQCNGTGHSEDMEKCSRCAGKSVVATQFISGDKIEVLVYQSNKPVRWHRGFINSANKDGTAYIVTYFKKGRICISHNTRPTVNGLPAMRPCDHDCC